MPAQISLWLENRTLYKKHAFMTTGWDARLCVILLWSVQEPQQLCSTRFTQTKVKWLVLWIVSGWPELALTLLSSTPVSINYYSGFMGSQAWVTGFVPSCREAALQGNGATWCTRTQHTGNETVIEEKRHKPAVNFPPIKEVMVCNCAEMEEKQRQRRREVEEIQRESHEQWQHSKARRTHT